jgi:hypothetical protein
MTSITVQDGKLVLRDGVIGTEQACCCKKCEGPCDEENPCPEGCICCNGECVEEIPEGECCGPCDEENPCPEGCACLGGECVQCEQAGGYCIFTTTTFDECPPAPFEGLNGPQIIDNGDGSFTCRWEGFVASCDDCNSFGGECNDPCNPLP